VPVDEEKKADVPQQIGAEIVPARSKGTSADQTDGD